mgnify:CR=1 FL=1
MHVDGPLFEVHIAAPHLILNVVACEDLFLVRHEEAQQLEFRGADIDRLVFYGHAMAGGVELQIKHADYLVDLRTTGAAQNRLDTGNELAGRERLGEAPIAGLFGLLVVWAGMALGHTLIVIQHGASPMGLGDTIFSSAVGFAGFALVWIGMKRPETQGTVLGYLGGNLIWCGFFEWTWAYFGHWLEREQCWQARIRIGGRLQYLGRHKTREAAQQAYREACRAAGLPVLS